MLRLLSNNHPFTYALLFILAFVLRLPSFHSNFFETDESLYLICAQKVVDGGVQYIDTWDNKPPVLIWFYSFFVWAFGSGALMAIRIFTCIYLFISAVIINQIVADNKILKNFSLLPAFLLLFLCSVPWYAQELNGELLMLLPVILSWYQLFRLKERDPSNNSILFFGGLLMGLSFMIKYQAVFLFLGMVGAYIAAFPPRISELFSLLSGFLLSIFTLLLALFFTHSLPEYWDIGILYNLDYILLGRNPGEQIAPLDNIIQYLKLWGVFIVMSVAGIVYFRVNYFTHSIRLRKMEVIILAWYMSALLTILVGMGRLYLHYFFLLAPPLVIYASKFTEFNSRKWLPTVSLMFGFAVPIFTYAVFLIAAFPTTFSFVDPYLKDEGWVETFRQELNQPHILSYHIDPAKVKNGVLVLDLEPELYLRLGVPCATKYTNFSMAWYKFSLFPHNNEVSLLSDTEELRDIYEEFKYRRPEYIIDHQKNNLFKHLKEHLPLTFAPYKEKTVGKYKIYYL